MNEQFDIRVELRLENPYKGQQEDDSFYQNVTSFVQPLMNLAGDFVQLNKSGLDLLIIVDQDKLEKTIFEIQDKARIERNYTGQYKGYYATAGKTISYLAEDGNVISSVIIVSNLFYEIIGEIYNDIPFENWNINAKFCFYILVHELGHCYDDSLRKNIGKDVIDLESENNLEILGKHYSSILISEFLASYYAGKSVTSDLQDYMIDNWREDSKKLIDDLLQRKMSFHHTAFSAASHSLWVILMQYAKLVGHKMANKELPLCYSYYNWESEVSEIFLSVEEILKTDFTPVSLLEDEVHISQNPTFDLNRLAFKKFYPIWEKLANEKGFFFDEEDD